MRSLGWFAAVLLAIGWIASEWPTAEEKYAVKKEIAWRRTASGWENAADWSPATDSPPAVHPLAVAAAILCFSAAGIALVNDDATKESNPANKDSSPAGPRPHHFAGEAAQTLSPTLE